MSKVAKYSKRQIENIQGMLRQYVDDTENPTLQAFISQYKYAGNPISRQWIEKQEGMRELLEFMLIKREAWLINQKRDTFSIFELKQPRFGYTDTPQIGIGVNVQFTNSIPRPKRKKIDSK